MKLKNLCIAALAAVATVAGAAGQDLKANAGSGATAREAVFGTGEKLTFALKHSLWPSLELVNVVFQTSATVIYGTQAFKLYANGTTNKQYRFLYNLNDTYEAWLDYRSLRPLKFASELNEGKKYKFEADYTYDWTAGVVQSDYHKLSRPVNRRVMKLPAGAGDALAIFYNLRCDDIASYRAGEPQSMQFVMDDTVRVIKWRYIGRETKKMRGIGTFRTLKVACSLASSEDPDGEMVFKDGSEFYVWISDDRNHMPLYIESPIKVGSIVAALTKYEGLKYPLTSKIK